MVLLSALTLASGTSYAASRKPSVTSTRPEARATAARVFSISASDQLQAALEAAQPGDQIEINAGATLVGNFLLPFKSSPAGGNGWITVRTSAPDDALPPPDHRMTPAYSSVMAQLVSPNPQPTLRTEAGAHHYRFVGIEFTIAPEVMLNYGIVRLGDGDETDAQTLPHDLVLDRCYIHGHARADVSRGVALNSASTDILNSTIAEIHGIGFDTQAICGWNGPGPFRIINNRLEAAGENVLFGGADPGVANLVPSDIEFRRNDCAKPLAWEEGILSKPINVAATPQVGGLIGLPAGATVYYRIAARTRAGYDTMATSVASDEIALPLAFGQTAVALLWESVGLASEYQVYRTTDAPDAATRNWVYYTTPDAAFIDIGDTLTAAAAMPPGTATRWSVKNLFELKNARRVTIDGNLFEHNWVDAQSGFAIQLTVRNQDGKAPWSTVENVAFTNNIIRHSAAGINILGRDNNHPSAQAHDLLIRNNLFYDIGGAQWGGNGRFLQITEAAGVNLDSNTILQTGNIITAYGVPSADFTFMNNLALNNDYGIIGDGTASGNATLETYLPVSTFKKNALVGGRAAIYPKKNYFPASLDEVGFVDAASGNFRLSPSSLLKSAGVKGRDVGADLDAIENARGSANGSD
ncbi:MAG: hypothetical protein ACJ74J_04690 [Blastocatellia bacterium]